MMAMILMPRVHGVCNYSRIVWNRHLSISCPLCLLYPKSPFLLLPFAFFSFRFDALIMALKTQSVATLPVP